MIAPGESPGHFCGWLVRSLVLSLPVTIARAFRDFGRDFWIGLCGN